MSYIDSYKHEMLGYFNKLPIYRPLVEINGSEFKATPDNLVIGGGSGEHPALVISNLGSLALDHVINTTEFILNCFDESVTKEQLNKLCDLSEKVSVIEKELVFYNWNLLDYHEFVENAFNKLQSTPLEKGEFVENWIKSSIGEFVYLSLPKLNPYKERIDDIINPSILRGVNTIGNVSCPPPGYIKTREESIKEGKFQEVGHFGWRLGDYLYWR